MVKQIIRKMVQLSLLAWDKISPTEGVITLLYHKTTNINTTPSIPNIDLTLFDQQMRYLKEHGYHTLSINDLYNYFYNGGKFPPKSIVITFDDGYKENIEAYKIVHKYGFTAICFAATGYIGQHYNYMPFLYDKTEMNFNSSSVKNQDFEFMDLDDYEKAIALGIEFAPHTEHHVDMSLIDEKRAVDEIVTSMNELKRITSKEQICFSYPFGLYNKESKDILQRIGIKLAFAVYPGELSKNTDPYFIPRNNVPKEWTLFKLILTNKYVYYMKISNSIRPNRKD